MTIIELQSNSARFKRLADADKKCILTFILFILCIGCDTTRHEQRIPSTIKVQVSKDPNHILMLSEIVEEVQYLRLQEESNHLIGNIDKIIPHNGRFYVLDRDAQKSLFVFQRDGSFLFQLNRQGQGPGEYVRPDDFIIDAFNHRLVVLDSNQRKLLFFDFDGRYHSEEVLPFHACSLAMLDANSFAFYLNFIPYRYFDQYYNVVVVQNGGIQKTFFRFKPSSHQYRLTPQTVFSSDSLTSLVIPTFNDTVFEIHSSQIISKYCLDFGDARLPKNFLNDLQERTVDNLRQEIANYGHLIQNFIETAGYVAFSFSYQHKTFLVLYDKASRTTKAGSLIGNDIDGGPFSYPLASLGDALVSVLEPTDIIEICRSNPSRISSQLIAMASTLTDLSNPVIALYKVKSF